MVILASEDYELRLEQRYFKDKEYLIPQPRDTHEVSSVYK
jgi:hypothetical protein